MSEHGQRWWWNGYVLLLPRNRALKRWEPILDTKQELRAREHIAAIDDRLRATPITTNASLMAGAAGIALFYRYSQKDDGDELVEQYLSAAIANAGSMGGSFAFGLAGIGWSIRHLVTLEEGEESPTAEIDEALTTILESIPDETPNEHFFGVEGWAVYALECLPDPRARALLVQIIERLGRRARNDERGHYWWTPPESIGDTYAEWRERGGFCNLGVAHGQGGLVGILASAAASGIAGAAELLVSARDFLWASRLPDEAPGYFPMFVGDPEPGRYGWCYGDAGTAAVILAGARGDEVWTARALEVARRTATRPDEHAVVVDPSLCHGAAGVGHMFNRIYQQTGDAMFRDAAVRWLERAMAYPLPQNNDLLEGCSGVGLALLAAISDVEPAWDRALLLSTRTA